MDANLEQYIKSNVSLGSVPSPISMDHVSQVMELGQYYVSVGSLPQYAYLSKGVVYVVTSETQFSFDMGEPIIDKKVIEFTARPQKAGFIFTVKSAGGLARDVYAVPNGMVYGEITDHVIKVAAGKMLVQDGLQDPSNQKPLYAIANNPDPKATLQANYIPLGAENQLDMYVGVGGVTDVFLDNNITDTHKIIGDYTLKKNGDLLKSGVKIDSEVRDIGILNNTDTLKMTRTSSENVDYVANIMEQTLANMPYMFSSSFIDAYLAYFKSNLATCSWAGVFPQGIGSVGDERPCLVNTNRLYHRAKHDTLCYLYSDKTGTTSYKFSSNVEYFDTIDANAFNAIASSTDSSKIQLSGNYVSTSATSQESFIPKNFIDMDITSGNMCIMT